MAHTYAFTVTTPAAAGAAGAAGAVTGNHRAFVSLLSDFGTRDASAGIMRAVVAGINPAASIVDLAHEVDKFAIRDGALLLWSAVPYLPIGAHVAVVDPGVGTDRKGIAVETARGDFLVGPDNGLLMPAAARLGGITRAHLLENPHYSLSPVSSSFHGRDIFAPAAAHLSDRVSIEELGRAIDPRMLTEMEWATPQITRGRLVASAIYIDSFGNVKLSAMAEDLQSALPGLRFGEPLRLSIGTGDSSRETAVMWATTFGSVPTGAPLLTADSYGRTSLAVHQGSAAAMFGVAIDSVVAITRPIKPTTLPGRPSQRPPR